MSEMEDSIPGQNSPPGKAADDQSGYSFTQSQLSEHCVHTLQPGPSSHPLPNTNLTVAADSDDPHRANLLKFQNLWRKISKRDVPESTVQDDTAEVTSLRLSEVSKSLRNFRQCENVNVMSLGANQDSEAFHYTGPVMVVPEKSSEAQTDKEDQRKSLKDLAIALAKSILAPVEEEGDPSKAFPVQNDGTTHESKKKNKKKKSQSKGQPSEDHQMAQEIIKRDSHTRNVLGPASSRRDKDEITSQLQVASTTEDSRPNHNVSIVTAPPGEEDAQTLETIELQEEDAASSSTQLEGNQRKLSREYQIKSETDTKAQDVVFETTKNQELEKEKVQGSEPHRLEDSRHQAIEVHREHSDPEITAKDVITPVLARDSIEVPQAGEATWQNQVGKRAAKDKPADVTKATVTSSLGNVRSSLKGKGHPTVGRSKGASSTATATEHEVEPENKELSKRLDFTPKKKDSEALVHDQTQGKQYIRQPRGFLHSINLEGHAELTQLVADLRRHHDKELDKDALSVLSNVRFRCAQSNCRKLCPRDDSDFLLCDFCGPFSWVRYCSEKCRLVDSSAHFFICGLDPIDRKDELRNRPRPTLGCKMLFDIHGYNSSMRQRQLFHHLYGESDYSIFHRSNNVISTSLIWPVKSLEHASYHLPTRRFMKKLLDAVFVDHKKLHNVATLYRLIQHMLCKGQFVTQFTIEDNIKALDQQFKIEFNFNTDELDCDVEGVHEEVQSYDWTGEHCWTLVSR